MWLEAIYKPTTLFSLRKSDATNPAAKTLISPSQYAVKMALLNACITFFSKELAFEKFNIIKDMDIRFSLPRCLCINNCFVKIQKEPKEKQPGKAFQPTVAFREYIHYSDDIKIAFKIVATDIDFVKPLLMRINYFGKRGCFFQFINFNTYEGDNLPDGYSYLFTKDAVEDGKKKILMSLDDFSNKAEFQNVDTYSGEKALRDVKIYCYNYEKVKANKNFTLYRRAN